MDQILEALQTTGMLIWYTLWVHSRYLISAGIQVLVTRVEPESGLGKSAVADSLDSVPRYAG